MDDAPDRQPTGPSDVWQEASVLAGTLSGGSLVATLIPALHHNRHAGEALAISLGYTAIVMIWGLVPLATYAFIYSFYRRQRRIGYMGAIALSVGVVLAYGALIQLFNGATLELLWVFTLFGSLHAVPTAVVAHFLLDRLQREAPRPTTSPTAPGP